MSLRACLHSLLCLRCYIYYCVYLCTFTLSKCTCLYVRFYIYFVYMYVSVCTCLYLLICLCRYMYWVLLIFFNVYVSKSTFRCACVSLLTNLAFYTLTSTCRPWCVSGRLLGNIVHITKICVTATIFVLQQQDICYSNNICVTACLIWSDIFRSSCPKLEWNARSFFVATFEYKVTYELWKRLRKMSLQIW